MIFGDKNRSRSVVETDACFHEISRDVHHAIQAKPIAKRPVVTCVTSSPKQSNPAFSLINKIK